MFLLTTHFSLGDLQSIRLWHDNSGEHPAWYKSEGKTQLRLNFYHFHEHSVVVINYVMYRYVNKVMVQDLETGQKWHFLCNSWLAVDVADCTLDKVFPVATESDLKRFR